MTKVAIKKREIVDKAFAGNRQRNVNVEVACIMKNGLAYSVKLAIVSLLPGDDNCFACCIIVNQRKLFPPRWQSR